MDFQPDLPFPELWLGLNFIARRRVSSTAILGGISAAAKTASGV
jgi:hypothetical protein